MAAAGALTLQLFAGTASAAVPEATATSGSYGNFSGDGWAGFWSHYVFGDNNLPKLFLEIDITGGTTEQDVNPVPYIAVTKNDNPVSGNPCSVNLATETTPLNVKCSFKTIRFGDTFNVDIAVEPDANATAVTATPLWSSTGYTQSDGGGNSHGDTWPSTEKTDTSLRSGDGNTAAGFGNFELNTTLDQFGGNGQAASLKNLPNGKWAYVNDNAGTASDSNFPKIDITVANTDPFQLLIVYPKGSGTPKSYIHESSGFGTETYNACQKGKTKINCFEWSNKNSTVTLYLSHNGQLRRSG